MFPGTLNPNYHLRSDGKNLVSEDKLEFEFISNNLSETRIALEIKMTYLNLIQNIKYEFDLVETDTSIPVTDYFEDLKNGDLKPDDDV
jgi:hypothetical protein